MNVFGGKYPGAFNAELNDPQDGGQYKFRIFGQPETFIGVFREVRQPLSTVSRLLQYNVLMLVPFATFGPDVQPGSEILPPELQPTDSVRRLRRSEVTLLKQLYISFTSRYECGELEFRAGMEGPYHINDEHTGTFSS